MSDVLGASVLCFVDLHKIYVDLHKISSSQTVNTIWAGQVFITCCFPGGSSCHRDPGSTRGTVPALPGARCQPGIISLLRASLVCPQPSTVPVTRTTSSSSHPATSLEYPCQGPGADVGSRGCQQRGRWQGHLPHCAVTFTAQPGWLSRGRRSRERSAGMSRLPRHCQHLSPLSQTLCV